MEEPAALYRRQEYRRVEKLIVDITTSTDPLKNTFGRKIALAEVSLRRGLHTKDIQFVNAGGVGNGRAAVTFNGQQIANYSGATEHGGHIRSFCAFGWYQHKWRSDPAQPDVNIGFENFQEGLI